LEEKAITGEKGREKKKKRKKRKKKENGKKRDKLVFF
jgi:hypothetical protein